MKDSLGLIGVAFVVLKLCHVIDWSWWWVTAPFWGLLAVAAVAFAVWTAAELTAALINALSKTDDE